jgi:lysophospholipase L1-like esterase
LSITSANKLKTFVRGRDWIYKNGRIQLPKGSAIPFFNKEELLYTTDRPGTSMTGKVKGTFVLFSEASLITSRQIAVTYIPQKKHEWKGPASSFSKDKLPNTLYKLNNKQSLKISFYGNSIETGCNSSGFQNSSPYMPSWPEMIVYNLRQAYNTEVNFSNKAVGGMLAQWGTDNVTERVIAQKPDLVIIGFGMNDGSAGISPDKYRENIKGIIDPVLAQNPKAEFILIAPMLPNPDAIQNGVQASYKKELDKLANNNIVVADITGVHAELLKHKHYQDMTGNNVNHPNDYLARWYAQIICGFLINTH